MTRLFTLARSLLLASMFLEGFLIELKASQELIVDNHFRRGFILFETKPGQHIRSGELRGLDSKEKPVWNLLEWSSRFPLEKTQPTRTPLTFSNSAKTITLRSLGKTKSELSFAANTGVEYGPIARKAGDPWVHLLVEQHFNPPTPLKNLKTATFHIEAKLTHARNRHQGDYTPDVHAAQFQVFFTVQNRNKQSPGYGDLLWFGIPLYDNRDRLPKAFKAQDFGGTAKFIFTPEGQTFTSSSAHDGKWVVIDKNLLPLMREGLELAWSKGFLADSKDIADYYIGGMNMGWELPGTFEVEMKVRNLSLRVSP